MHTPFVVMCCALPSLLGLARLGVFAYLLTAMRHTARQFATLRRNSTTWRASVAQLPHGVVALCMASYQPWQRRRLWLRFRRVCRRCWQFRLAARWLPWAWLSPWLWAWQVPCQTTYLAQLRIAACPYP